MKQKLGKVLPMATLLAVGMVLPAHAADFWDSVVANVTTVGTTSTADTIINGAKVKATWTDSNRDGNLDTGEPISSLAVYDRNGVPTISAPIGNDTNYTRDKLASWAELNAQYILNALFPAGLSEITGASDDNIMASASVSQNLFKKAGSSKKTQAGAATQVSQDIKADVEYLDLKVNDNKGSAASMVLGYSNEAASGLDLSLTVPYRYSSIKDEINSKSHFVGLDVAMKYPVKKWDKGDWKVGGAVFGSAFYLKTDTIENSGNLKYGGGLFTSATQNLGFGTLGVGVDYRIAKAYLPSSMNSDNTFLESAVDYINELDPVHTVSYGFNLGVPLAGDTAAVNLEVIRSNYISSDIPDGQKSKTSVNLSGAYFPSDSFELNLGVRYDFELDNVDTLGVMLGVIHPF
ncbi:MAG: hypothetical protein HGA96_09755 [Desulfobulbaceae bacterium]|nr:hypothetical protein [Desulfobulbaceae bacterium]